MQEPILWYVFTTLMAAVMVWKIRDTFKKVEERRNDYQAQRDHEARMRALDEQLKRRAVIDQDMYDLMAEQEKARIQTDWNKVWPIIERRIVATAAPIIDAFVVKGLSSVGIYQAVMNELNWNYLLEGAIPNIPPSGQAQINNLVQRMIDNSIAINRITGV